MSTKRIVVGTVLSVLYNALNWSSRSSGTGTTPTLGSMVQNGKFCACAFALESALNKVLLPTFGKPTTPSEKPMAVGEAFSASVARRRPRPPTSAYLATGPGHSSGNQELDEPTEHTRACRCVQGRLGHRPRVQPFFDQGFAARRRIVADDLSI